MLKRLIALLTVFALSLGLTVAMAAPASANSETCNSIGYQKPESLDKSSGDVEFEWGRLTWSGAKLDYVVKPGWNVDLCIKSGSGAGTTRYDDRARSGSITISQGISHLGFKDPQYIASRVDCTVATLSTGRALTNGDHINMTVAQDGTTFQVNASIDIAQAQDPASGSGLVARVTITGQPARTIPLSSADVASGNFVVTYSTYLSGSWTVQWVQFNSTYYNQANLEVNYFSCTGTKKIEIDPAPSALPPTCSADGRLSVPAIEHVTWTGGVDGAGPGSYVLVATPDSGYSILGQDTFPVQVLAKGTGLSCGPPPCIQAKDVTYTYDPATNSGTVTVPNPAGSSGKLCGGFWVTAVSWKFTTDTVWPQVLDQNNPMPENGGSFFVDEPGTYHYGADVTCGQGDIYASYDAQPVPTEVLNGPSDPYQEHFLHDMGFTGPTPTYTVDTPGCNRVTPVAPQVTPISTCDTDGSIVLATTPGVVYVLTSGDGKSGAYEVTATPAANHYFEGPQKVTFTGDLGTRTTCAEAVEPKLTDAVCDAASGIVTSAFITVPGTTGIEYRIGTTVLEPGKVLLPVGVTVVTATAKPGFTNTGPASFTITVSDDPACDDPVTPIAPTVAHEVCDATTGDVSDGELTFTRVANLTYSVDGVDVVFRDGETLASVPVSAGVHTVGYRAASGFFLADTAGLTTTSHKVTVEEPAECDKPQEYVAPRITNATCDAVDGGTDLGTVSFELVEHLTYVFDGTTVTADALKFERPAGDYTLVVTADDGYFIAGTGLTTKTFTITVAAPAAECGTKAIIPLDPFADPELCEPDPQTGEDVLVAGSITIVYAEHVTWTITDEAGVVTPVAVATPGNHVFPLPAGDYLVTATADPGYFVTTPTSFPLTVREPDLPCLPTYALLESDASWTHQVCSPAGLVDPTITVAPFPGVSYFIDGKRVTATTTTVAPGEHLIEAVADDPKDTVTTPRWAVTLLASSSALCGDLTTLALTGETPGGWLLLAVVLLQAGLTLLAIRLVRSRAATGRHLA